MMTQAQKRQDQRVRIDQMFTCGQKLTACLAELESCSESKMEAAEYKIRTTLNMKKNTQNLLPGLSIRHLMSKEHFMVIIIIIISIIIIIWGWRHPHKPLPTLFYR